MNRFLLLIIGSANGIDKDLNHIADSEHGVSFVDGKGIFICTFYSVYSTTEIHEKLMNREAIMIFDITNSENYGVNLPTKYYLGIFPELRKELDFINEVKQNMEKPKTLYKREDSFYNPKKVEPVEEYESVDDILDKLSRNNYDRSCLTEKELEILNKG
jgi:hypothetical protein